MSTVSQLEQAVEAIFGNADHLAREMGFVQRVQKGKLSGKRFAVTQTLGLLVPGGGSMSDLGTSRPMGRAYQSASSRSTF